MYPEELNCPTAPERPAAEQLAIAICHAASTELAESLHMVRHCLNQLPDDQLWQRDRPQINSIGNLVLHLQGNLRQWIIAGLGAAPDTRQRAEEFAENGPIPGSELLTVLQACVDDARAVLVRISPDELLRVRLIQSFSMTGIAAILHAVPHFRGHTQEIIRVTRQFLGSGYKVAWSPRDQQIGRAYALPREGSTA